MPLSGIVYGGLLKPGDPSDTHPGSLSGRLLQPPGRHLPSMLVPGVPRSRENWGEHPSPLGEQFPISCAPVAFALSALYSTARSLPRVSNWLRHWAINQCPASHLGLKPLLQRGNLEHAHLARLNRTASNLPLCEQDGERCHSSYPGSLLAPRTGTQPHGPAPLDKASARGVHTTTISTPPPHWEGSRRVGHCVLQALHADQVVLAKSEVSCASASRIPPNLEQPRNGQVAAPTCLPRGAHVHRPRLDGTAQLRGQARNGSQVCGAASGTIRAECRMRQRSAGSCQALRLRRRE